MGIKEFSSTIQSNIYKEWLKQIDKNLVTQSAKSLRSSQEVASKTDFLITKSTVKEMYKIITGLDLGNLEAELFLKQISKPSVGATKAETAGGVFTKVNGENAVLFESIGFDTITSKLTNILDSYDEIQDAYQRAEEEFVRLEEQILDQDKSLKGKPKQIELDKIRKEGKRRATFGFYFNKGHVIGVATNLAKDFRKQIENSDKLADKQRKLLIEVLDKYISKLEKDDLDSANLPNAVEQEIYAKYIKSSSKYLVEIQLATKNQGAGRVAGQYLDELRSIFGINDSQAVNIVKNSPLLGQALIETEGSPSYIDLLANDLVGVLKGTTPTKKVYTVQPVLIAKKITKIKKPKSNKQDIAKFKQLKSKLNTVRSNPNKFVISPEATTNLVKLQNLINQGLVERVKQNMGRGERRDILNLRSGRFAESVKVERMSQSREGMITAFYSYMKNPYATFSDGGLQSSPRTRDPKLLIARSIREIAQQQVQNRLRSVAV